MLSVQQEWFGSDWCQAGYCSRVGQKGHNLLHPLRKLVRFPIFFVPHSRGALVAWGGNWVCVSCIVCILYVYLLNASNKENGVWLSVSGEYKKLGAWWTHCIYIAMLLNRAHHTGMASLVSVLLHTWPCFAWLFSCDQPIWSAKKNAFLVLGTYRITTHL